MPRRTPRSTRAAALALIPALALATVALGLRAAPAGAEDGAAAASASTTSSTTSSTASRSANPVTPGAFTGYGFDQCLTPEQYKMDAWLAASPFRAVGIYISGASRGCRDQPNLTPTWVSTQLTKGWRLLPITLGPQAYCNPRFPRYGTDPVINAKAGSDGTYGKALAQGQAEAVSAVASASALGIVPGSTLWYDLEGYDNTNTVCRESSLQFLSGWTQGIHQLGYVSGVYSSAGSGIKALDDARVDRPGVITMPDQVWIARWDGVADTSTSYVRSDGWTPGGRVKQYQGGHDEKWGGVTINIDRNYLDLGATATTPVATAVDHCHGTPVDLGTYKRVKSPTRGRTPDAGQVTVLKCLLKEQGVFRGKVKGAWSDRLTKSVHKWQRRHGLKRTAMFSRSAWMTLLSAGATPTLALGASGEDVRRVQRALNAASAHLKLPVNGAYDSATQAAVVAWQGRTSITENGVVGPLSWAALQAGKR